MKVLLENRKALFDFDLIEKYQAGLVLLGFEVKSLRLGRGTLQGSYIIIRGEEAFWIGANIPPYQPNNTPKNYIPKHERKILITKKEIKYLIGKTKEKGLTLVPIKVYTNKDKIKLEFALVRNKKKHDKRQKIKERETERTIDRALKGMY
ncbi:MAG TPA: SsrA-binding protein SmpB [Candidatus Pacearchaeota archaeon]|nr:SsrA-binding protein SmpB [Candidatus Pacearchaeota archaeon]